MSRKRVLSSLVLLGCVAATGAGYLAWDEIFPPPPGVNPRNFARIRPGMGQIQVHEILGESDGDISMSGGMTLRWVGEEYEVYVEFGLFGEPACSGTCRQLDGSEPPRSFGQDVSFFTQCRRWLRH